MNRIFLIGYMGSGKTSIGKVLSNRLDFSFVDMDHWIEEKYFKSVSEIFAAQGQDKFREIEQDCLHQVADFESAVIATGGGAPCFFDNMKYMNSHGLTVYIKLTPNELVSRLETSRAGKRPLLAERKGEELRKFIEDGLVQREPYYSLAKLIVSGNDEDIIEQIVKAFRQLK